MLVLLDLITISFLFWRVHEVKRTEKKKISRFLTISGLYILIGFLLISQVMIMCSPKAYHFYRIMMFPFDLF